MIDATILKTLVSYDAETGEMVWLERPHCLFKNKQAAKSWNTRYSGKKATTVDGKGYLVISIFEKRYLVHRLAWLYTYGEWPDVIDHINGVKTDNRLCNIRNVTQQSNHMNNRKARNNTSGATGVYLNKRNNLWCAQMKFNGKTYHLGSSRNFDEAVQMRKAEEKRLGFSERHGSDEV